MYLRFITIANQCSCNDIAHNVRAHRLLYSELLLQQVQEGYTWRCFQTRSLGCWASIRFVKAYPSQRDVRGESGKICPDICLQYVCSDACSNLLPFWVNIAKFLKTLILKTIFERMLLTVRKYELNDVLQLLYKQPSTGIHNTSMKIENSCQILEKSIKNKVVGVGSF